MGPVKNLFNHSTKQTQAPPGKNLCAANLNISSSTVAKAEPGFLLRRDPITPGSYIFLLSNGEVVTRRNIVPVNIHPFDWPIQTVHRAHLRPQTLPTSGTDLRSQVLVQPVHQSPETIIKSLHSLIPTSASTVLPTSLSNISEGQQATSQQLHDTVSLPKVNIPLPITGDSER